MVLEIGDDDFVARLEVFPSPGRGNQIDRFTGAAGVDDLRGGGSIDVAPDDLARAFVILGHLLAKMMQAAMHIRVAGLVDPTDPIDDLARFLG